MVGDIISKGQVSTGTSHGEQRQHTTERDQQVHARLYEYLGPLLVVGPLVEELFAASFIRPSYN